MERAHQAVRSYTCSVDALSIIKVGILSFASHSSDTLIAERVS